MTKWQDLFAIMVMDEDGGLKEYNRWHHYYFEGPAPYIIYNKEAKVIVGRYKDFKYATRQARYKFRKIVRTLERKLLG